MASTTAPIAASETPTASPLLSPVVCPEAAAAGVASAPAVDDAVVEGDMAIVAGSALSDAAVDTLCGDSVEPCVGVGRPVGVLVFVGVIVLVLVECVVLVTCTVVVPLGSALDPVGAGDTVRVRCVGCTALGLSAQR